MSNELDQIVDIRFNIKHDNPFRNPNDLTKTQERTNNFYKIITSNPSDFRTVDWINDPRIKRITRFDNMKIFKEPVGDKLADNKKLSFLVADCLKRTGEKLERGLIPELKTWVDEHSQGTTTPIKDNNVSQVSAQVKDEIKPKTEPSQTAQQAQQAQTTQPAQQAQPAQPSFQLPPPNFSNQPDYTPDMIYKSTDDVTTYDITPGKQLSYEDLCHLTVAIARSQLTDTIKKDENVLFIEEREKDRIRKSLEKYLGNADIAAMYPNLDINNLSLKQLQYYSVNIEDYYETLKLMNFMKKGLDIADLGYTSLFPEGIPMPGGKYKLKLDGTVESIKKVLFDRESPVKVAFKNIQEKYNLHISDEFLLCLNIGSAICSKIHFDKVEEKPKSDSDSETDSSESSETSESDEEFVPNQQKQYRQYVQRQAQNTQQYVQRQPSAQPVQSTQQYVQRQPTAQQAQQQTQQQNTQQYVQRQPTAQPVQSTQQYVQEETTTETTSDSEE